MYSFAFGKILYASARGHVTESEGYVVYDCSKPINFIGAPECIVLGPAVCHHAIAEVARARPIHGSVRSTRAAEELVVCIVDQLVA